MARGAQRPPDTGPGQATALVRAAQLFAVTRLRESPGTCARDPPPSDSTRGARRDVCFLKGRRAATRRASPGEGVLLSAAKPMGSPAPGAAQARGPCAPSRGAGLQLTAALRLPQRWDGAAAPRARAAVQGPGVQTQHRGLRARASSGGERWHRKRGREAVCRGSGRHGARREAAGASGVACHGAAPRAHGGGGGAVPLPGALQRGAPRDVVPHRHGVSRRA